MPIISLLSSVGALFKIIFEHIFSANFIVFIAILLAVIFTPYPINWIIAGLFVIWNIFIRNDKD